MDNEGQMRCPSMFNVLRTDTDKGTKVCTTVWSRISELY